ncbi:MAG TPA: hypothetical protein VI935_11395 [Thermodesulfobacteriota bacterium]|nr:hypothetical protein [Thermodesulfobacteriota bacterium]
MSLEKLTEGWVLALQLYGSAKTVSFSDHNFTNGSLTSLTGGRERNTFISREFGFRGSWPNGWMIDNKLNELYKRQFGFRDKVVIPIVVIPQSLYGGFRPSVTVAMDDSVGIDINSYIENNLLVSKDALVEIIKSIGVDIASILQFHYLSLYGVSSEERIFQIQKVALTNNKAYIVTASQIPESELKTNKRLRGDLDKIMTSFSIVSF